MIAEGVMNEARDNGRLVLCGSSSGSREVEKRVIRQFSQSILDGLIYIPVGEAEDIPAIETFRNLPLVVAVRLNIFKNVPHVYHDGEKGGYLATKYLIQLGRTRIGFVASFWSPPCTNEELLEYTNAHLAGTFSSIHRFKGYLKALEEAGIPYDPKLVAVTTYSHQAGVDAATALIGRFTNCNGIIAMTQIVANGCVSRFKSQGYKVPEDLSVIIFDSNKQKADYAYTNVELSLVEMGQIAVRTLDNLIKGKKANDICIDVTLQVRETTSFLHPRENDETI
jgi:LacI family transcriptional regulator